MKKEISPWTIYDKFLPQYQNDSFSQPQQQLNFPTHKHHKREANKSIEKQIKIEEQNIADKNQTLLLLLLIKNELVSTKPKKNSLQKFVATFQSSKKSQNHNTLPFLPQKKNLLKTTLKGDFDERMLMKSIELKHKQQGIKKLTSIIFSYH